MLYKPTNLENEDRSFHENHLNVSIFYSYNSMAFCPLIFLSFDINDICFYRFFQNQQSQKNLDIVLNWFDHEWNGNTVVSVVQLTLRELDNTTVPIIG